MIQSLSKPLGEKLARNVKQLLAVIGFVFIFAGCATLKRQFCDCAKEPKVNTSSVRAEKSTNKASTKESVSSNEGTESELTNRMSQAVDVYVFGGDKVEFTNLCADSRFDCFVNDKRFPAGRKKIKRKNPASMSGSKMGLQNNERVRVRYEFYP